MPWDSSSPGDHTIFVQSQPPTDCASHEAQLELDLCIANELSKIASNVGILTWDRLQMPSGPLRFPPQSVKDRFIANELAIYTLANLAWLAQAPPLVEGEDLVTCETVWANAYADPAFAQANRASLLLDDVPTVEAKRMVEVMLRRRTATLRSASELLKELIERSYEEDVAGAEQARGRADGPRDAAMATWGDPADKFGFNSARHALRILGGRWDYGPNGGSFDVNAPIKVGGGNGGSWGAPECERITSTGGVTPFDMTAWDFSRSSRLATRAADTVGQTVASELLSAHGIVLSKSALASMSSADIRDTVAGQLAYNLSVEAGAGFGPQFFGPNGRGTAVRSTFDKLSDNDLYHALSQNAETLRLLTGREVDSVNSATLGPWIASQTTLASLPGVSVPGALNRADAVGDPMARYSTVLATAACADFFTNHPNYVGTPLTRLERSSSYPFQSSFAAAQVLQSRLGAVRDEVERVTAGDPKDVPMYREAALAAAQVKAWAGPARMETEYTPGFPFVGEQYSEIGVQTAFVTLVGLEPRELGVTSLSDMPGRLAVVVGDPRAVECYARLRTSCPADISVAPGVAVVPPSSPVLYNLNTPELRRAFAGEGTALILPFDFSAAAVAPSVVFPTGGSATVAPGMAREAHLVMKEDPKNPGHGRVLGKLIFREATFSSYVPAAQWNATTFTPISTMQQEMLAGLVDGTPGYKVSKTFSASIDKSRDYCIPGVRRDLFVPLENEITSDGDQYESSWRHYLAVAKEAALKADALGEKLIDIGLQQELRREQAAEAIGDACGAFPNVDNIGVDPVSKKPTFKMGESKLASCAGSERYDVLFLGTHPYELGGNKLADATDVNEPTIDAAVRQALRCSDPALKSSVCDRKDSSGVPLVLGKARTAALNVLPPPPSGVNNTEAACQPLFTAAKSIGGAFDAGSLQAALTQTFSQGDALSNAITGLRLDVQRREADMMLGRPARFAWWLSANSSRVVMDSEDLHVWPGCLRPGGTCPTDATTTAFADAFSRDVAAPGTEAGLAQIRFGVERALWTLAMLAGRAPEGLISSYVPALDYVGPNDYVEIPFSYGNVQFVAIGTTPETYTPAAIGPGGMTLEKPDVAKLYGAIAPSDFCPSVAGSWGQINNALAERVTAGDVKLVRAVSASFTFPESDSINGVALALATGPGSPSANCGGSLLGGTLSNAAQTFANRRFPVGLLAAAPGVKDVALVAGALRDGQPHLTLTDGYIHIASDYKDCPLTITAGNGLPLNQLWPQVASAAQVAPLDVADWDAYSFGPDTGGCKSAWNGNVASAGIGAWDGCRAPNVARPALPFVKRSCAERPLEVYSDLSSRSAGVMTQRVLLPTQWPPASRLTYLAGAESIQPTTCGALASLTQALLLSCTSGNPPPVNASVESPPTILSVAEMPALRGWLSAVELQSRQVASGLYIVDAPKEVAKQIKGPGTEYPASDGKHGTLQLQLTALLTQVPLEWEKISLAVKNIGQAIQKAESAIAIAGASETDCAASLAIARSQAAIAQLRSTVDLVNACAPHLTIPVAVSFNPAGCYAQANLTAATKDAIAEENAAYNQKAVACKAKEQGEKDLAILGMLDTVNADMFAIQTARTTLVTKTIEAYQLLSEINSLETKVSYEAAKAANAPYAPNPDPNGPPIPIPVNMVLSNQYDLTKLRYQRAERDARHLGFMARLAVEQRLGVRLENIKDRIGPDDPPVTWAEDICMAQGVSFDKLLEKIRSTPGYFSGTTTAGAGAAGAGGSGGTTDEQIMGEYAKGTSNPYIGDYIERLERFVQYYNVEKPSHDGDDVAVLSLRDDLLTKDSCARESNNRLYLSGDLSQGVTVNDASGALVAAGWTVDQKCDPSCLVASSGSGVPNAPLPPDGATRHQFSWLHEAVPSALGSSVVDAITTGSTSIFPKSVGQQVRLEPGSYVVSWWDGGRANDGDVQASPVDRPYRVRITGGHDGDLVLYAADLVAAVSTVQAPWSARRSAVFTVESPGLYSLAFGAVPNTPISVLIGGVQVESLGPAGQDPGAYEETTATRQVFSPTCPGNRTPEQFRAAFEHTCTAEGCFYQLKAPLSLDTAVIAAGEGKLTANIAARNFNYRHITIAANFVGTGIKSCAGGDASCYSSGFLQYSIEHDATDVPIVNYDNLLKGDTVYPTFDFGDARINHAKGLAAERVISNPLSSGDKALLDQFLKPELKGRPLDGSYRLKVWDQAGMDWNKVEDIQIVLNYRYWAPIVRGK